jgi:hypothetical protein
MSNFLLKNPQNRKTTNKLIKIRPKLKYYTSKQITISSIKPNSF